MAALGGAQLAQPARTAPLRIALHSLSTRPAMWAHARRAHAFPVRQSRPAEVPPRGKVVFPCTPARQRVHPGILGFRPGQTPARHCKYAWKRSCLPLLGRCVVDGQQADPRFRGTAKPAAPGLPRRHATDHTRRAANPAAPPMPPVPPAARHGDAAMPAPAHAARARRAARPATPPYPVVPPCGRFEPARRGGNDTSSR